MEKKEMKMYEAPAMEVVEMEVQAFLCVSTDTNVPDVSIDDEPATQW